MWQVVSILIIGARRPVDGAVTLARALGITELVIGLTIVAAGTSLPEVATSVLVSPACVGPCRHGWKLLSAVVIYVFPRSQLTGVFTDAIATAMKSLQQPYTTYAGV